MTVPRVESFHHGETHIHVRIECDDCDGSIGPEIIETIRALIPPIIRDHSASHNAGYDGEANNDG